METNHLSRVLFTFGGKEILNFRGLSDFSVPGGLIIQIRLLIKIFNVENDEGVVKYRLKQALCQKFRFDVFLNFTREQNLSASFNPHNILISQTIFFFHINIKLFMTSILLHYI